MTLGQTQYYMILKHFRLILGCSLLSNCATEITTDERVLVLHVACLTYVVTDNVVECVSQKYKLKSSGGTCPFNMKI